MTTAAPSSLLLLLLLLLISIFALGNAVYYEVEHPNPAGQFTPKEAKKLWVSIGSSILCIPPQQQFGAGSETWIAQPVVLPNRYSLNFTAGVRTGSPSSRNVTEMQVQLANIYLDMLYKYMNETQKARFQQRLHNAQFQAQQPPQGYVSATIASLKSIDIRGLIGGHWLRPRQIPESLEGASIGGHWLRPRQDRPRPHRIGQGGGDGDEHGTAADHVKELGPLGEWGGVINATSIRTQLIVIGSGNPNLHNDIVVAWEKGVFLKYEVTRPHFLTGKVFRRAFWSELF